MLIDGGDGGLLGAGREWIVDASGCPVAALRDDVRLRRLVDRIVSELDLHPAAPPQWRVFPGEGGVTCLVLLTESHLALHTFPELGLATFNLYCCRARDPWPWPERLQEALSARDVLVREVERGGRRVGDGGGDSRGPR